MDPRSNEELARVIDPFVLRLRRVTAHSLAQDDKQLDFYAGGAWLLERDGAKGLIRRVLPGEESLESLAARIRPTILQGDAAFYGQALRALSVLHHRSGQAAEIRHARLLRKAWRGADPSTGAATYYAQWSTTEPESTPVSLEDVDLALAWFYGDLIHADEQRRSTGTRFPIGMRYAAAAVRVAQLALLSIDTLAWLTYVRDHELVDLLPDGFDEPVAVAPNEVFEGGEVYVAPGGTPMPTQGAAPDLATWTRIPGLPDGTTSRLAAQVPWSWESFEREHAVNGWRTHVTWSKWPWCLMPPPALDVAAVLGLPVGLVRRAHEGYWRSQGDQA